MTAYWSDPGFQTKNSSEWVNDKHINLLSKSAYVRRCVTEWNGAFSTLRSEQIRGLNQGDIWFFLLFLMRKLLV